MNRLAHIWVIFAAIALVSCDKTTEPAYLHIESVELEVEPDFSQGTNAHGIRDAWVYLNDRLVGIYELPATVPIISEGEQKITILGGVLKNGIQTARITYPFYQQYVTNLDLKPGVTIDFSGSSGATTQKNGHSVPVLRYFETGLVFWNERFEDAGVQFEATAESQANMSITQNPAQVYNYNPANQSTGSGIVVLEGNNRYFEVRSTFSFPQIAPGTEIYLELNYHTACTLQVGVYQDTPFETKVYGKGIRPNNQWSKIYIDLTPEVRGSTNGSSFSIFIEGILDNGQNFGEVFIDNVKLVYPG